MKVPVCGLEEVVVDEVGLKLGQEEVLKNVCMLLRSEIGL